MCEKKKPTIAELGRMLDDDFCHIRILPSGEVTIDTENCPYRERCHASAAEAGEPAANISRDEICADTIESESMCDYCQRQGGEYCGDCDEGTPGCHFSFLGRKLRPC